LEQFVHYGRERGYGADTTFHRTHFLLLLLLLLRGAELLNYMMAALTCSLSLRHITAAHLVTSSFIAPAGDDVMRDVAVWCQPCGRPIAIVQDDVDSLANATYELKLAIRATVPLVKRLQRSTLVYNIIYLHFRAFDRIHKSRYGSCL